ncbi:unnamed protein product [Sphagnum balticum]
MAVLDEIVGGTIEVGGESEGLSGRLGSVLVETEEGVNGLFDSDGDVVPPKGWSPRAKDYEQRLVNLMVRHPIEQNVQGTGGFYEARNIVRDKMPLKQYRRYAEKEGARVAGLSSAQKQEMGVVEFERGEVLFEEAEAEKLEVRDESAKENKIRN